MSVADQSDISLNSSASADATIIQPFSLDIATSSSCTPANASSFTWSHAVGTQGGRYLVVSVVSNGRYPTGVSYGGTPLTELIKNNNSALAYASLWKMASPPSGTANLVVTFSANTKAVCGAANLTGIHPTAPYLHVASIPQNGPGTFHIDLGTSVGDRAMDTMAQVGTGSQSATGSIITSGATSGNGASSNVHGGMSATLATTTTTSLGWTVADGSAVVQIGAVFRPSSRTLSSYRWLNDDGNEAAATFAAAADTPITFPQSGVRRLRTVISNPDSAGSLRFRAECRIPGFSGSTIRQIYNLGSGYGGSIWGTPGVAAISQSFTATNEIKLASVKLQIGIGGAPSDGIYAEIAESLDGPALATSNTIPGSSLSVTRTLQTFAFASPPVLSKDVEYMIRVFRTGATSSTDYYLYEVGNSYAFGEGAFYSSAWASTTTDAAFEVYGSSGNLWQAVGAQGTTTSSVRFADSAWVADGGATTQKIGTGTFRTGHFYESPNATAVSFLGTDETEIEAVLQLTPGATTVGSSYECRWTDFQGSVLEGTATGAFVVGS